MSIWKASHWTVAGFSVLIASERNCNTTLPRNIRETSFQLNHCLVFITVCFVYSTKCTTLHTKTKPWTHSTCCKDSALLYMCHFSSVKCSHNEMKEILFEVSTFFKSSMFFMSWRICRAVFQCKTIGYAHSPSSWHVQASFLASLSLTWNALPTSSKPPLSSCRVDSRDIQTQPFPTVCYWHLLTKRTQQRNKGMAEWHTKSLV